MNIIGRWSIVIPRSDPGGTCSVPTLLYLVSGTLLIYRTVRNRQLSVLNGFINVLCNGLSVSVNFTLFRGQPTILTRSGMFGDVRCGSINRDTAVRDVIYRQTVRKL